MNKYAKRKLKFLSLLLMLLFCMPGCGQRGPVDRRPVDEISRSIKNTVGKDFGFHEKKIGKNGETIYRFEIMEINKESIGEFQKACNSAVLSNENPIDVTVLFYFPGGWSRMYFMKNHNDEGEIYEGMYYLRIGYGYQHDDIVSDPMLYTEMENIRELHVAKEIQEKADEMGIDWYEYWPDLETLVVEED